jgi:2,7-dihydroxy-5-methyl-1-naphthoate 7-O-methyltransferase
MAEPAEVNVWAMSDLCTPWCIHVVATLRIADHIADGASEVDVLAARTNCDSWVLGSVLRHLVAKGVFTEPETDRFELNNAANSLRDRTLLIGLDLDGFGGRMAYAWSTMLKYVRTGAPAYHEVFGLPFWDDLDAHPEIAKEFDDLIGPGGHGTPDPEVLVDGDWETVNTVVDVGGGTGALLAEILRNHPTAQGTLVDLPRTVARSREIFENAGVTNRVTTVGQSFFEPLPRGADLYVLKSILNDWPDPEAASILKCCAEALNTGGRIVIVGGVSNDDALGVIVIESVLLGGKQRTVTETRALAEDAGLEISKIGSSPTGGMLVECRLA